MRWGFGTRPQARRPAGRRWRAGRDDGRSPAAGAQWRRALAAAPTTKRYRIEFYASAQNLLNHANYMGYSGVMTSPLFGRPTNAAIARRAQVGIRFGF